MIPNPNPQKCDELWLKHLWFRHLPDMSGFSMSPINQLGGSTITHRSPNQISLGTWAATSMILLVEFYSFDDSNTRCFMVSPAPSWFHHASTSLRSRGRCCLPAWPFALPWLHICRFFWVHPHGLYHVGCVIFIYIAVPDAPCMEYLPTFEPFLG